MADKKISALTAAALPLAGTEVLPIVQSGATVKVASDDLTVKNIRSNATTGLLQVVGPATGTTRTMTTPNANFSAARIDAAQTFTGTQSVEGVVSMRSANALRFYNPTNGNYSQISNTSGGEMRLATGGGDALLLGGTGDATVSVGNVVIGTAAKGIDFSANTHAAGMTSELLDWYEEGTFTPSFNQGFTAPVSYTTQTGKYTRIGDMVYFHAYIYMDAGQTRAAVALALAGLPFPVASGAYISLVWNYAAGVVAAGTALPTIYSGGVFYNTGGSAFLGTALTSARPEVAISGFYKTT